MATINSALNLITSALEADQSALNIVANNVANANTVGYSRQVPNWQENSPAEIGGVYYGTGATQTGPTSVRDRVLEERLAQQQQSAAASSSRLSALDLVQSLFAPDSGASGSTAGDIGSDITKFFSSFASLEANPTDSSLRQQVLSTASTLAGDVSNAAASLNSQRSSLDQEAAGITKQVNSLTAAIAKLNEQIQSTSPDGDAGTLEDERQLDLGKLSQLIGINHVATENNGLSITTTSGDFLLSEGSSFPLTLGTVGGDTHFFLGTKDITSDLARGGGELGGLLTARDQDIPTVLSSLDELAFHVSDSVNQQNYVGTDLNGAQWDRGQSPQYFQTTEHRCRKCGDDERGDDRPERNCRCGIGKGNRRQLERRHSGWPCCAIDRRWKNAFGFLFQFCDQPWINDCAGGNRKHCAERLCNSVANAERCALERESQ